MSPALDCTVVLPTYHRAPLPRAILRSPASQDLPAERLQLLTVDDRSTDGTPEAVDRFRDRLNLGHHRLPDILGVPRMAVAP